MAETSPIGGGGVLVTTVLALFSSFGSFSELTVATFVNTVPAGVPAGIWNLMIRPAPLLRASDALVQMTSPLVAPGPGSEHEKSGGAATEMKLQPPVIVSFIVTCPESFGPALKT